MNKSITIQLSEGTTEKIVAATWISAKNTLELSKINREQTKMVKEAKDVKAESERVQAKLEEIKRSEKGIEDPEHINGIISVSENLIKMSEEITEHMDDILIRKANIICKVYNDKFDFDELMTKKDKNEISAEFTKIYDFANGIIRKN